MSGNYPDVPSWRLAYDRDGSQGFLINRASAVTQLSGAQMIALNDESDGTISTGWSSSGGWLAIIFPELRDLDAYFVSQAVNATIGGVAVSANTTNGLDGTWTSVLAYPSSVPWTQLTVPNYRNAIVSTSSLAIKAVRFEFSSIGNAVSTIGAIHLYGEPIPGANPNRLALWHPTLDQRVTPAHFDWGDVPRSSSADKTFRVKNLSSTLTGNSIRVAQEILTDTTPSVVAQHTLSYGGGSFLAQVNIGALAPGAISGVITLRRVTPSNATLSVWAHRVFAEADTWS